MTYMFILLLLFLFFRLIVFFFGQTMNMCSMRIEIDMVILCFAVLSRVSFLLKGNTKAD